MHHFRCRAVLAAAVGLCPFAAHAVVLDLTTAGSSATDGQGALFVQDTSGPAGTGFIDSFVRIQRKGTEQGYNTDHRPVQFDEKTDANFTRAVLLADAAVVTLDGTEYRLFRLDINEANSTAKQLVSLDQLVIHSGSSNVLRDYDPTTKTYGSGGTSQKLYDLDATTDNWIKLNADLQQGSGHFDMLAFIPNSYFADATGPWLYLYSEFGRNIPADAGFEEWAFAASQPGPGPGPGPEPTPIPTPSAAFAGAGLLGLVVVNRLRKRRAL